MKVLICQKQGPIPEAFVPDTIIVSEANVPDNVSDVLDKDVQGADASKTVKSRMTSSKLQKLEAIQVNPEKQTPQNIHYLFAERHIPGAKCEFRLNSDVELNYGPRDLSESQENYLVRIEFIHKCLELKNECPKCKSPINLNTRGVGLARNFELKCNCGWSYKDEPATTEVQLNKDDARTKTRTTQISLVKVPNTLHIRK